MQEIPNVSWKMADSRQIIFLPLIHWKLNFQALPEKKQIVEDTFSKRTTKKKEAKQKDDLLNFETIPPTLGEYL